MLAEADQLREAHLEDLLSFFPIVDSKEKKKFIRWYQHFPGEKLSELWNQLSPTLQALVKAELQFFSRSPLLDPPLLQLLLFMPPETMTSYSIRGGMRELKKLFFDRIDYLGGLVHPMGEEGLAFVTKGLEIRSVQLRRYNFPTRCRYVLGNINIQTLYDYLPRSFFTLFWGRSVRKKVQALRPAERPVVFQYRVASSILPEPMKENVLWIADPRAAPEGMNYMELNLSPMTKPSADGLDTLITVTCRMPLALGGESLAPAEIGLEVEKRLHKLIPFANGRIRPFGKDENPSPTGELFPEPADSMAIQESSEKASRRNTLYTPSLFFPTLTSPYKNLFTLGPNILDWLGLEGKMLAALKAVETIWAAETKSKNS